MLHWMRKQRLIDIITQKQLQIEHVLIQIGISNPTSDGNDEMETAPLEWITTSRISQRED